MIAATARPSWVVIPAQDEARDLPACLDALRVAAGRAPGPVRVIVVDDGSTDDTAAIAQAQFANWRAESAISGCVVAGRAAGVGWARRTGIERAIDEAPRPEFSAPGASAALIATTDADSRVDPAWLGILHDRLDAGHQVVAGDVHLDPACDPRLAAARAVRLAVRLAALPASEADHPHPHFAGSNLGFAIEALRALGPLPTPRQLEDQAILERCRELGIPVLRDHEAIVVTSARTVGRAAAGLAEALAGDLLALQP